METKWLEDFLALAETGNFTRAAQARNASQAAFSRRIQALEMAVNANLVDRSIYPTKLTPAGEAFRARAAEILARLREAVQDISAGGPGGALRIALPSALGATFAGRWLKLWAPEKLRYSIEPGGVHDMFTALASGRADLLITYYSPLQPIQIDPQRFERLLVGQSHVRPYAHRDVRDALRFPGTPKRPVRLLDFPPTVYFGRLIETIIERAPQKLHADRIVECEMADVLRDAALSGLGIVWLPACVVDPIAHAGLEPVDDGSWTLDVEIMAFRDRESSNPALCRLWERLKAAPTLVPSPH